jgi:tetratricopeptide (TPR) repeat protein/transglutaminase-like putative cysteine protease
LYQDSASWVHKATLPPEMLAEGGTTRPFYDFQQRFEHGQVWTYFDIAQRISAPEQLTQNSVLTLPWYPDKGDLIIHELSILRGTKTIDVLAGGQKFTVMRREQALEQQQLTGILSATLALEGLQVGDTIRLRASVTNTDLALAGHVQWGRPLVAEPDQTSGATMRLLWPKGTALKWKVLATGVSTTTGTDGAYSVLNVTLPAPRQPEVPVDAPGKFRHPPLIEASSFADWREVSRTMAPLFAVDKSIAANSPLASEVARIAAADPDPLRRAASAVRLVQDKVRYFNISMDGGNYVPQPAEKTWAVRYGDCKAKTLLLLTMLHSLGMEAEPVLANLDNDDLVPERLPSAGAFNHVFVRARIAGQVVWLDGTATGTRLADLHDTPRVRNILPLRREGATLESIALRAPERPTIDLTLAADESTSVDLPTVIDATLVVRGPSADALALANAQVAAKERRELLIKALSAFLGTGQFGELTFSTDPEQGTATIRGRGVLPTAWQDEDHRRKRAFAKTPGMINFDPDRSKPGWAGIPVATPTPDRVHIRTVINLPAKGSGISLDGEQNAKADVAGYHVDRVTTLSGGVLTTDETLTASGLQIGAADIPADRDRLAQLVSQAPRLVAPADTPRRWDLGNADSAGGTQLAAALATFAAAAALAAPDDTSALEARSSLLAGIGDYRGAIADWARVIAIAPSAGAFAARAELELEIGDTAGGGKDAEAARKLDPANLAALNLAATAAARRGDVAAAAALYDQRIALGGENRNELRLDRANIVGLYGDPVKALADLDAQIAANPGKPDLLNARCWTKALRQVQLDTALKDCTRAVELSDEPAQILDSRAMVWLRMNRLDEALADLDAALLQAPGLGPSRFVRALVLRKLGRTEDAARDLAIARRISPGTVADYARFDLVW